MVTRKLRVLAFVLTTAATAAGAQACGGSQSEVASGESANTEADMTSEIKVGPQEREAVVKNIATKKATCPFVGAAVAMESAIKTLQKKVPGLQALRLLNTPKEPLAPIVGEGSIEALGNTGDIRVGDSPKRSTLGYVIAGFALGNHGVIPESHGVGEPARGDKVPENTFSLDFPASKGSHPGHSFILQGNPNARDSGAFSASDFARLVGPRPSDTACPAESQALAQGKADEGGHAERVNPRTGEPDDSGVLVVRRSEFAKFVAENVFRDPNAKAGGKNGAFWKLGKDTVEIGKVLTDDLGDVVAKAEALRAAKSPDAKHVALLEEHRDLATKVTTMLGEDNIIGGAGEYALLLAFLQNSPKTVGRDTHDPGYSVEDITLMFKGDAQGRRLPDGWETWNKDAFVWAKHTTALLAGAAKHYHIVLKTKCR